MWYFHFSNQKQLQVKASIIYCLLSTTVNGAADAIFLFKTIKSITMLFQTGEEEEAVLLYIASSVPLTFFQLLLEKQH